MEVRAYLVSKSLQPIRYFKRIPYLIKAIVVVVYQRNFACVSFHQSLCIVFNLIFFLSADN